MSASLPEELIELVLRAGDTAQWGDEVELDEARDRRRTLRSASLVSRDWYRVATRLLAECLVVTSFDDLSWLENAVALGHLRGEDVRSIIVDDSAIESVDALEAAWKSVEAAADAAGRSRDRQSAQNQRALVHFFTDAAEAQVAAFAGRLLALIAFMPLLSGAQTAFARTVEVRAFPDSLRYLVIGSTSPCEGYANEDWAAGWPEVPESVENLRIRRLGEECASMPPLPAQLRHLRTLSLGAPTSALGFATNMLVAPVASLVRLDVVLSVIVADDPRALFRIGYTDVPSMPSLRILRIGITACGLGRLGEADLLGHLPPSVSVLEYIGVHDPDAYEAEGASDVAAARARSFAAELRSSLHRLPAQSRLSRLALNIFALGLDGVSAPTLQGTAAFVELVAACDGRGIGFAVENEDRGAFWRDA